jgi:hypothetical protein
MIVMTSAEKRQILDNMMDRLAEKMSLYHHAIENDKIFEVTKKLRLEIKELTQDIETLKQKKTDDKASV